MKKSYFKRLRGLFVKTVGSAEPAPERCDWCGYRVTYPCLNGQHREQCENP